MPISYIPVIPAEIMARFDLHTHETWATSPKGIAAPNGNEVQTVQINGDFWCYSIDVYGWDTDGNVLSKQTPRDQFTAIIQDQLRQFSNVPEEPFDFEKKGLQYQFKGWFMNDRDIITATTTSLGIPASPANTYPVYFRYSFNGYILVPKS